MSSSTVFPLSGLDAFETAGFAGFSALGSGAAIPGFSRVGPAAGFGWGPCGLSCAASGRATQSPAMTTSFRINFLTFKV
jgi:hypothetical protein